jgi:hypothetical protein
MQKVVGSNPISRFFANALHVGGLVLAQEPEIKWNHPRISPLFQALIRISARNRSDGRRSASIADRGAWLSRHGVPGSAVGST